MHKLARGTQQNEDGKVNYYFESIRSKKWNSGWVDFFFFQNSACRKIYVRKRQIKNSDEFKAISDNLQVVRS